MESVHSVVSPKNSSSPSILVDEDELHGEKKKYCSKKRIKLLASILVILMGALSCALLITPQPVPPLPPRQIPDRYTYPELLAPEDRELFSDIRTSFIPTGSIALPPKEGVLDIYDRQTEDIFASSNSFENINIKEELIIKTDRTNQNTHWKRQITSEEKPSFPSTDDFIGRLVVQDFDQNLKIKSDEFITQFNRPNKREPLLNPGAFSIDTLYDSHIDYEESIEMSDSLKEGVEDLGAAINDLMSRQKRDSPPENLTVSTHVWQGIQEIGNTPKTKEIVSTPEPAEAQQNDTQQDITEYLRILAREELKDKLDSSLLDVGVREIVETDKIQLLGENKSPVLPTDSKETIETSFWNSRGDPETIRKTQSNIMKRHMDHSVDPCEDFYQYACGNWPQLNPIPADKAGFDTFEMLRENLDVVLRDLLSSGEIDDSNKDSLVTNFDGNTNFLKSKFKRKTSSGGSNLDLKLDSIAKLKDSEIIATQSTLPILNRDANPANYDKTRRTKRNTLRKKVKRDTKTLSEKEGESSNNNDINKRDKRINKRKAFYNFDTIVNDEYKVDLESDDIATVKAKYLYESCMNYDILQQRAHQPLLDLLDTLGGWPILSPDWDASKFDWLELMAHLRLYNNDILLSEWVGPDIKNSDEFVIQFDQTSLGLPTRDYFLQPTNKLYLDAYKNYLIKIATLLGSSYENALEGSDEIILFETKLAKLTSATEDRRNISELYQRLSVKELTNLIPKINWNRYLNVVLNRTVSDDETVVIFALKYAEELVSLIEQTEPKIVANYLLWRFVRHRVNNLDDKFQEAKQRFYYILFGREQAPPRWKNCVAQVNSNMGMALGAMFVKKYFDENSKNDTLIMTRDIQESFRELLNMTTWIDSETKILATDKVDTMTLRIGYPDFILNHDELNEKYKEISVHPNTYFENTLNILKHLTKTEQARLGQPVNKTQWNTAPAVVNAYYSRNKNQIMFPAGILQPPFYHRYFPKSLNFGGIGVVIGHEITHGFDDKGRLFDKYGNLHRWWHDLDIKLFHKKAQCLIDQYSEYTVSEVSMSLDGVNTQGENIADNGGIKQAFRAYQYWLTQNSDKDETLPGLNATNTQLFFLNFAQVWCGAMRPEAMKNKLKTAVHSPGKFRVIGTVSNSEDFARVFNCPVGSPMNPVRKCNVW